MIHVSEGQMYDMAKAQIHNLTEGALYGFKLGMQRIVDWYKIENPSPHVLTYEDLACEQGLNILNQAILPNYDGHGHWRVEIDKESENAFIFSFEPEGFTGQSPRNVYVWFNGDTSGNMSLPICEIFRNTNLDPESSTFGEDLGYDWKLPNGEVVKAIFLPKTQVDH